MTLMLVEMLNNPYMLKENNSCFDFDKLVILCTVYGSGSARMKAEILFERMVTLKVSKVEQSSMQVPRVIEIITILTCYLPAFYIADMNLQM